MASRQLRRSREQERRDARDHGGRVQSGSGCGTFSKGDVRTPTTLVENKRTDKQQMTIKNDWLEKIRREALSEGRVPVLGIEIGGREWVMLPKDDYLAGIEQD